jgi:hypothetical protein
MGSLDPPTSGAALNSILSSSIPLDLDITSNGEVELNMTQGYDPSDVLSLLHGGLVLQHEFDRVQDDRFETHIVLPEGLFLEGKDPVAPPVSGRSTYLLPWGLIGIGSDKAPIMPGENVRLTGVVRMEDLRSVYLIDSVIAASADLELELGWIEYDPSLVGTDIDIDYRVDHLSADMIRLLLKMGIAEESDIKERISRSIERFLDDSIGTDEITIGFQEGTLSADDLGEIDGTDPLLIDVHVESTIDAADPNSGSEQRFAASRAYIPFHMDPILPVKRYEKTVPLSDCERWNLSINITFPTGAGVKGWLGREGAEHGTALPVIVVDGVPTMVMKSSPGEAEALYLEISGGPYLAFDNVVVCFFGTWTFLAVIVLLVLVSVIKRIVKRARNWKVVKPKVGDSDLDPNDVWSGSGKVKGRPPVRPRR